jgi:hypothetical protein
MSSSANSPCIVIQNCGTPSETVNIFHDVEDAQALWATLTVNPVASHYLFIQPPASKEMKPNRVDGSYVDAYGVARDTKTQEAL